MAIGSLASLLSACAEPASTGGTAPSTALVAESSTSVADRDRVTPKGFELVGVTITPPKGDPIDLTMWLADEPALWGQGLTDVTDLGDADGMLFSFDEPAEYQFFMWQTPMPLDVVFFDGSGMFVGSAVMEPCLTGTPAQCPRYSPGTPYREAIEVPGGSLDDLELGDGARLTFEQPGLSSASALTTEST